MNQTKKNGFFIIFIGLILFALLFLFQFRKIQSLRWDSQYASINSIVTDTYMANTKQGTVERNRYKVNISYGFEGKDYDAIIITGHLSDKNSIKIRVNPEKPDVIIQEPSWGIALIFGLVSLMCILSGFYEIIKR